jgi:hypothetical protein
VDDHAEMLLEPSYLVAERVLRDAQARRGPADVQLLGDPRLREPAERTHTPGAAYSHPTQSSG